ncbi:hypothetical protein TRVA0_016S00738 [Trichomonascus vanleenenianus]|uniref:Golgi transport complex subunit COG6 n=1 Tax=Trichomonascus vanleenenianus TaxID=2268995 RepID=UPI003ECAB49B
MEVTGEGGSAAPIRPDYVISQKISNILSTSYADSTIRIALEGLDTRVTANSVETRRNLRSSIEAEVIRANGQILKELGRFAEGIRDLGASVGELNRGLQRMEGQVSTAKRATSQIVRESEDLRRQDEKTVGKQVLLKAFRATFVLSEAEVASMAPGAPLDDRFFATLARIKQIHGDCQALLATGSRDTGIEIMGAMSERLDAAYDRLHQAVERELKSVSASQSGVSIGRGLRKALAHLAERPTLFDDALNGLCEKRQKNLATEFIAALTGSQSSSQGTQDSKPIDFYAHDTLRYIGDVLAWIHAAAVGEKENLEALFGTDTMASGIEEGLASEPWMSCEAFDSSALVDEKVDRITGALVKPMKARIEQVLAAEPKIATLYEAQSVLMFYRTTFCKHLRASSPVVAAIEALASAAMHQFNSRLEDRVVVVRESLPPPPEDLQPPEFLLDALGDLRAVLSSCETSVVGGTDAEKESQVRTVIDDLTEPFLECCSRIASDMRDGEAEIFSANCLDAARMTLSLYAFASYKLEQLDGRIEELAGALADHQLRFFSARSGLGSVTDLHSRTELAGLVASLDDFLPAATMESSEALHRLNSPRLASTVTLRASEKFLSAFKELEDKLRSIYGDSDEFRAVFPRTSEDVRVLLALD